MLVFNWWNNLNNNLETEGIHPFLFVYGIAQQTFPSDTMAHGTMLLLLLLTLAVGPAVGFYGGSMTFTPGNRFPDGSVEVNTVLTF